MATDLFSTIEVTEFLQRTTNPKFMDILSEEYNSIIDIPLIGTCEEFKKPQNKTKNKFEDVPCWDHTRVTLFETGDGGDYINASYLSGFDVNRKFIAAEHPTANTLNSFWTMVWEENSRVIVMLSGVGEESEPNSTPYLYPCKYNTIVEDFVIQQKEIILNYHYTETVLTVTHMRTGESKTVNHFKYFNWPVDKFPEEEELLELLLAVNKKNQEFLIQSVINNQFSPGPIVVHGKAGIGRTAAFCAVDVCVYQLIRTTTISVPSVVLQIRLERNCSFPALRYYMYIYNILIYFLATLSSNYEAFLELRSHYTANDLHLLYNAREKFLSIEN